MNTTPPPLTLYGHYRSSAAYRTRIALNLKALPYETISINLLKGEQSEESHRTRNPAKAVPVLDVHGEMLTQSLAIIEYLDETVPEPPLLPREPLLRARVRAFALAIACDIHPLNNLRVLQRLTGDMGLDAAIKDDWYHHWIREGLAPLELAMVKRSHEGAFCFGDRPTLADVCLVPQLANARRTQCDLTPYLNLLRIESSCMALDAFRMAAPENQAPP